MIKQIMNNVIKKIILPFGDMAMNTSITSWINKIYRLQKYSKKEIDNWQNNHLQRLIQHAYNNTLYYKELFDENNLKPSDIKTKSDLEKLPILTKQNIIDNYDRLTPSNIKDFKYKKASTGGSTGNPMKYILDLKSWSFTNANNIVNWEKTSYRYGMKYVSLGSTSINLNTKQSWKHRVFYHIKNKISLNGINMSDEVCESYIKLLNDKKIKYIYGYASALYLLAKYAINNKTNAKLYACFSTSEMLTPFYRDTIIKAFDCEVVNCYGARDGGITAFAHQHDYFEVGYNCIVHTGEKNTGMAQLTDLFNYAMPLINYELGDEVEIGNPIEYDYNGQILKQVLGRSSEVMKLENGRILTGPGFTILFKDMPVESYSIKQLNSNTLCCYIKKTDEYTLEHEKDIHNSIQNQAGINTIVQIEYVDDFNISKSGKRQYFIN